jgi:hypothetical protein
MTLPHQKPTPARPSAMTLCACGARVLTGETTAGLPLTVELAIPVYLIVRWSVTGVPQLWESAGYPVHRCVHQHPNHGEEHA